MKDSTGWRLRLNKGSHGFEIFPLYYTNKLTGQDNLNPKVMIFIEHL